MLEGLGVLTISDFVLARVIRGFASLMMFGVRLVNMLVQPWSLLSRYVWCSSLRFQAWMSTLTSFPRSLHISWVRPFHCTLPLQRIAAHIFLVIDDPPCFHLWRFWWVNVADLGILHWAFGSRGQSHLPSRMPRSVSKSLAYWFLARMYKAIAPSTPLVWGRFGQFWCSCLWPIGSASQTRERHSLLESLALSTYIWW